MDFTIDPEISNLCRVLTDFERSELEQSLREHGCLDSLKIWNGILIDGHNRREICERIGKLYDCEVVPGIDSREQAVNWVIRNQLGRRNLIAEDVSYLRGKRYEAEKISSEEHIQRSMPAATDASLRARGLVEAADKFLEKQGLEPDREKLDPVQKRRSTAQRLGKELGVSDFTMLNDAKFANAVDKIGETLGKEVSDMIRTGRSGLTKAGIIAFAKEENMTTDQFNDLRFEHQQRKAKVRKERKKSAPKAPPLTVFKPNADILDNKPVERMRAFQNALIQIATTPVTASTLAGYTWPEKWREQVNEALPAALEYLSSLEKEWSHGAPENRDHDSDAA